MRFGIVEGEPGIFPDPIARIFRAISRLVRRRPRDDSPRDPGEGDATPPTGA